MRLANECILRMVMSKSQTTSLILSSSSSLVFSSWWWLLVLIFCRVLFFMGRTQQLFDWWRRSFWHVCQSVSLSLSLFCFGVWTFWNFIHSSTCIEKFNIFQHTQEKRKEKKRRETTFLIRLFTRTSSYTHRRHLKHIKERERDYLVCRLSTTHTLSTLFLSLFFSLSLSSFEKKVWRTRRNVRRSWKPGERN